MRRALFILLALLGLGGPVYANWCATPGKDGTLTISGVVNTYYAPTLGVAAGATSIGLSGSVGAGQAIAAGDLILVIQMQDATIEPRNNTRYGDNTNGTTVNGYTSVGQSGRYEFVRATNSVPASGGTLTIVGGTGGGLANSYNLAAADSSRGRRTYQVIKVPQYDQVAISGTVSALAWNGSVGGVVAIDVARRLTFSGGTVTASGLGFRGGGARDQDGIASGSNTDYMTVATGGLTGANGSKGEGIGGTPRFVFNGSATIDNGAEGLPGGSMARGGPANAGGGGTDGNPAGNDQNAGGGGGGNGGAGGGGGHAWCLAGGTNCPRTGGHPGAAVAELEVGRIVMGGGGGAGSTNNSTGFPGAGFASSGAAGGGIVLIRAAEIAGTGSIRADGADANSTALNDASGGGGAGGSILVSALRTLAASIVASANGGDGGSNTGAGNPHGPGGGGGGGFIATSSGVSISTSANGGSAGSTAGGALGTAYGATGGFGASGTLISGANIPGASSGGECTPTIAKSFASSPIPVGGASRMSIAVTNNNPTTALTGLAFTDTYPAGLRNAAAPAPAISCGSGSLAAAASGGSLAVSGSTIGVGATCTYSVTTTVTSTGDKTNTIPAEAVTGNYGSFSVRPLEEASAVLQVSAPLTIVKASQVHSDPVNGTANAKAVPGSFVTYTVTVANPGSGAVDSNTIVVLDATPANLRLFVSDVASGAGPLLFQQGSTPSGLSYSFAGLASLADDIDFSSDGGTSWSYVPVPDAAGVDTRVTHFRVRPKGAMIGNSSFSLQFRYLVR
jgi:uncharacterized repeat protein (TIGR01451 family)